MAIYNIIKNIISVFIGIYAFFRIHRMMRFFGLDVKRKLVMAGNLFCAVLIAALCNHIRQTSAMFVLHILVLSLLLDVAALVVRGICRDRKAGTGRAICRKLYECGLVPVVITAVLFSYGYINMKHIIRTEYTIESEKRVGNYRIVLITDTHYATIQDTNILKNKAAEISEENPDLVVLGGDIVEEGTSKERMQEVFKVLGGLESRYGVYYVYGNHDRQPYTNTPGYTDEELEQAILDSGITILEDSCLEIAPDLVLAGRKDAAWGRISGRASVEEILDGVDREKYIVMVDHQPIETEENGEQGVDLMLSGHTHAGQIWPVGVISEWMGTLNYGAYRKGDCQVIVSSGFTGWGYPVRTQEHCEYVVVDIAMKLLKST